MWFNTVLAVMTLMLVVSVNTFAPPPSRRTAPVHRWRTVSFGQRGDEDISPGYQSKQRYEKERARKMGVLEGEEYDLETALDANTDDTIVKILAVSFILPLAGGLIYAVTIFNT